MKKILTVVTIAISVFMLFACSGKKASGTMSLGGKEYDAKFVVSGYYLDKATMSDAALGEMLSKVEVIDKPASLGECILPNFSEIELTANKKEEITDAMVEAELEAERDKETTYETVKEKRNARLKDKVIMDFKGFVDGEELEGGAGNDYELVLGSGDFIPGFEDKVVGHPAGKKFTIDVVFPKDYAEELAGKPAQFEITIKSIEEPKTPEIDEEFVKKHTKTGSTTVEEYKAEVKKRLEDKQLFLNNQNLIYQLSDKLFDETKFSPTEEALAWQFSVMINQYNEQAKQNNMTLSDMLTSNGGTVKSAYDEIKDYAHEMIKQNMIMDALKSKYPNVTITDEGVKKWFNTMAEAMGYGDQVSYDDYVKYVGYDNLRDSALQQDLLLEVAKSCKIVESKETEE